MTAGEVTLFLVDDARGGIRTPVATLAAPSLVVPGPPPDGRRWVLGSGLGARVEELDLARDEELLRDAASPTPPSAWPRPCVTRPGRPARGSSGCRGCLSGSQPGAGAAVEEVELGERDVRLASAWAARRCPRVAPRSPRG